MERRPIFVGIDLGTTYSSIGVFNEAKQEVEIIGDHGDTCIPSVVSFHKYGRGHVLVGHPAKNVVDFSHLCYDSKKLIGTLMENVEDEDKNNWPFDVVRDDNGFALMEIPNPQLLINPRGEDLPMKERFYPEEISAIILKHLKNKLDGYLTGEPDMLLEDINYGKVVISVPFAFNSAQRKATLDAAKLAGFKNVEVLNEPTASIIAYKRSLDRQQPVRENMNVVVVDFGETLDVACCTIRRDNVQIRRRGYQAHSGGKAIDRAMMELMATLLEENGCIDNASDYIMDYDDEMNMTLEEFTEKKRRMRHFPRVAERAKIELSTREMIEIRVKDLLDGFDEEDQSIVVCRQEFEERCEEYGIFSQFQFTLDQTCREAGFTRQNTSLVLLVGGSCQIPRIQKILSDKFGRNRLSDPTVFNGMEAVCKGACYYAKQTYETFIGEGTEINETLNSSIGIKVANGRIRRVIERDTPIPTPTATYELHTAEPNLTKVEIPIYTGEAEFADDVGMQYYGTLVITNIPPRPEGFVTIRVTMKIETGDNLVVTAHIVGEEGHQTELRIKLKNEKVDEYFQRMLNHVIRYWPSNI